MADWEPPQLIGCAAALCADRGQPSAEERLELNRRRTKSKRGPAGPLEYSKRDIFAGCIRCGLHGEHRTAAACINALRDRLAMATGR